MLSVVSLPVEFFRIKPRRLVWFVALVHAALWTLIPSLFFAAPPGALVQVLATARDGAFASREAPPLAYWLADAAFQFGGLPAVYALSQLCVVATFLMLFALGRQLAGPHHGAVAALALIGITSVTLPSPAFGPAVLAMPLWALTLLHLWWVLAGERRLWWLLLGADFGLLLLTTPAAPALIATALLIALLAPRGRADFCAIEPWLGFAIMAMIAMPALVWIDRIGAAALLADAPPGAQIRSWTRSLAVLLLGHAGLVVLVLLAYGMPVARKDKAPTFPLELRALLARRFVMAAALTPLVLVAIAALFAHPVRVLLSAPLVVLSGLLVAVLAPQPWRIVHHHLIGWALVGLLILPPVLMALALAILPRLRLG